MLLSFVFVFICCLYSVIPDGPERSIRGHWYYIICTSLPHYSDSIAQKAKYSFSDDDEDDDDDFVAELALSPSFNLEEAIDNDAIDSDADDFSLPTKRPVKRAAPKIDSDSDSADESGYKETKQDGMTFWRSFRPEKSLLFSSSGRFFINLFFLIFFFFFFFFLLFFPPYF